MTIKEQIFIEDKYRQLQDDLITVQRQLEDPHEDGWDFGEMDDLIDQLVNVNDMIRFIDDFITFANYEWRELESGWTLFEREEG